MVVAIQRRPKTAVAVPAQAMSDESESKHEAPPSDHEISVWRPDAYIVEEKKEVRRYLRRSSMRALLGQIKDGVPFRFKGMLTSQELGQPEFHLIIKWLKANGLVSTDGRDYIVASIENVKRRWNEIVTEEAVL